MRAWPVARSIFDAPLGAGDLRKANERTTSWISQYVHLTRCLRTLRAAAKQLNKCAQYVMVPFFFRAPPKRALEKGDHNMGTLNKAFQAQLWWQRAARAKGFGQSKGHAGLTKLALVLNRSPIIFSKIFKLSSN